MNQAEQGGAAMIMVIMLLLMSAVLLNATRRQMDSATVLVADEQQWYRQTSLAASALQWGARRHWPRKTGWQCKTTPGFGRACLQIQPDGDLLLRGDSGTDTIAHFQWVEWAPADGAVRAVAHGWLDYCPLAKGENCDPDG